MPKVTTTKTKQTKREPIAVPLRGQGNNQHGRGTTKPIRILPTTHVLLSEQAAPGQSVGALVDQIVSAHHAAQKEKNAMEFNALWTIGRQDAITTQLQNAGYFAHRYASHRGRDNEFLAQYVLTNADADTIARIANPELLAFWGDKNPERLWLDLTTVTLKPTDHAYKRFTEWQTAMSDVTAQ